MYRPKSPFKKKSPKEDQAELPPPPSQHLDNIQELHERAKHRQLVSGNAWAQQKANRGRSNSERQSQPLPDTPMTTMSQFVEAGRETPIKAKTPKKSKKNAPAPLKLVPDGSENAIPTQRESFETKRHQKMEASIYGVISEETQSALALTGAVNADKHPKSPSKKFFSFFKSGRNADSPPKTPDVPVPLKASKVLGDGSLGKKKGKMVVSVKSMTKRHQEDVFDFSCAGIEGSSSSDEYGDAPSDFDIKRVNFTAARPLIIPSATVQRTVSDTATVVSLKGANTNGHQTHHSDGLLRSKSLRYMNDSIPPTPPSKDTLRIRGKVTDYPPLDISAVLGTPDTPDTEIHVGNTPLPPGLCRFGQNEYLKVVMNKPSTSSLRGALHPSPSVRSSYGFITNSSTDYAPESHLNDAPVIPKSAGFSYSKGRSGSLASDEGSVGSSRARMSRRWSEGSIVAPTWKERPTWLLPTFYSPHSFVAPANFPGFKPSRNNDPLVYHLPRVGADVDGKQNMLPLHDSLTSSDGRDTPSSTARSSIAGNIGHIRVPSQPSKSSHADISSSITAELAKAFDTKSAALFQDHSVKGLGLNLPPSLTQILNNAGNISPDSEMKYRNDNASARPSPLSYGQQPAAAHSTESIPLPAGETLDGYLALHHHVNQSHASLYNLISAKHNTTTQELADKHHENIKFLNAYFGDVLERLNAVEHETSRATGGLHLFKKEIAEKLEKVIETVQSKILDTIDKLVIMNGELSKSVDLLVARLQELEKKQQSAADLLTARQPALHQHTLPSMRWSRRHSRTSSLNHTFDGNGVPSLPSSAATSVSLTSTTPTAYSTTPDYPNNGNGIQLPQLAVPALPSFMNYAAPGYSATQWNGYMMPYSQIKELGKDQRQQFCANYGGGMAQQAEQAVQSTGQQQVHPALRSEPAPALGGEM